jgi:hypothetical protein
MTMLAAVSIACGSDFTPKNAVRGIRILAASADLPYARPGESVRVEALTHDGRPSRPADSPSRMRIYWFPAPCIDPPGGQYYACYPLFEALYPTGVDLGPALVEGNATRIKIPENALADAVVRPGQDERFATAYVFMVACAGHVERVPRRSGLALNALPLGCIGPNGETLGGDDFIVGFTRVFVFESRRNSVPSMGEITFDGRPVDPGAGIVTNRCGKKDSCTSVPLDLRVRDEDAEIDPDNVDADGVVGRETIYVDWFTSVGELDANRKVLIDGALGRPPKTMIEFTPPEQALSGTVWAVLHDNRGGTTWRTIPINVR